jgi:hypothetical protein
MAAPIKFMITYVSPGGSLGLDVLGFRTLTFGNV